MAIIQKVSDLNIIKSAAKRTAQKIMYTPRKVFLFSGHMIDQQNRIDKRFPSGKESIAKERITGVLEQLDAGKNDLALVQGACGGDILFTEVCIDRGVKVVWLQPFKESDFIRKSVEICGDRWLTRYMNAKMNLYNTPESAINLLGELPKNSESGFSYKRCNLWLLHTALSFGADKVHFITLWNGEKGDGPGGTAHMYEEVKNKIGQVIWINTNEL